MSKNISVLLKHSEPAKQIAGINMAVNSNAYILIPGIVALTASSDQKVAQEAVDGALDLSKKCLETKGEPFPEAVTTVAAKTITRFDQKYIAQLYEDIKSTEIDKVISGLIILKFFINERKAEALLHAVIKHPSPRVRATAVLHIGYVASKVGAEVLSKFLDDADNRVKANTIEVLEKLKNKVFVRILQRFKQDKNNRIRANALKALFYLGEPNLEKDFEAMLLEPDSLMRTSAVWAIGDLGRSALGYLPLLKIVKNDPNELVRNNLLVVLKKLGDIPEIAFLKESLKGDLEKQLKNQIVSAKDLEIKHIPSKNYYELVLKGVITAQTVLALKFQLSDLLKKESRLVMDFTEIEYIDSSGIGLLVNVNKSVRAKDGFLYLHGLNFRITELFQLSKLYNTVLNVFQSLDEIHDFLNVNS